MQRTGAHSDARELGRLTKRIERVERIALARRLRRLEGSS
jgi:hypothetical protein